MTVTLTIDAMLTTSGDAVVAAIPAPEAAVKITPLTPEQIAAATARETQTQLAVRRRRERLASLVQSIVPGLVGILIFLLLWQGLTHVATQIPGPAKVWDSAVKLFSDPFYRKGPNDQGIGWNILAWAGQKSFVKKPPAGESDIVDAGGSGSGGGASAATAPAPTPAPAPALAPAPAPTPASALQSAVAGRDESAQFKGERRSNDTHQSTTDPEARLYRKGRTGAELRFVGHTLMDNRHGLISDTRVTQADGHCEREAAKAMIQKARAAIDAPEIEITLGADKGYDAKEFIEACVAMNVVPHVSQNTAGRRSAVPDEIAASAGYAISVQKRKLIEQGFGWAKTIGSIRQVMQRGLKRVNQIFTLTMAAYNLTRMRSLAALRLRTQQ